MNDKQIKAIQSLERAFKKCAKANLAFQGMDGSLESWDADDYTERTKHDSICEQQYIKDGDQGYRIDTHETYKDSGGW